MSSRISRYPVLNNRPIDQWKFTELKEELKRRKLVTEGLKDDLIRRLDDALRVETESAEVEVAEQNEKDSSKEEDGKGSNCNPKTHIEDGGVRTTPVVAVARDNGGSITQNVDEMVKDTRDNGGSVTQKVVEVTEDITPKVEEKATAVDNDTSANLNEVENNTSVTKTVISLMKYLFYRSKKREVTKTVDTEIEPSAKSQDNENQVENEEHPHEDNVLNVSNSTTGLKDDLVRRLDGELCVETESANTEVTEQNEKDSSKEDGKGPAAAFSSDKKDVSGENKNSVAVKT